MGCAPDPQGVGRGSANPGPDTVPRGLRAIVNHIDEGVMG